MKTVLFGGTTEGRELSGQLAEMGADITVSVFSEYGARQLGEKDGITICTGPRTADEMMDMIEGADLVIDATHPFAQEVTANIAEACRNAGVRNIRLIRAYDEPVDEDGEGGRIIRAGNREEAAKLAGKGNVLLTTGVRDLPFYCEKLGSSRTYARVLPTKESIEACIDSGMEPSNIIAMQGPFSVHMNEALIEEFDIDVLITKESGRAGGLAEKLRACERRGTKAIVITRPEEEGMPYEEVLEECRRLMGKE